MGYKIVNCATTGFGTGHMLGSTGPVPGFPDKDQNTSRCSSVCFDASTSLAHGDLTASGEKREVEAGRSRREIANEETQSHTHTHKYT